MKQVVLIKKDDSISIEALMLKEESNLWLGIDNPDTNLKTIIINHGLFFSQLNKDFLTRIEYKDSLEGYLTSLLRQEQVVLSFKSRKKLLKWWLK